MILCLGFALKSRILPLLPVFVWLDPADILARLEIFAAFTYQLRVADLLNLTLARLTLSK